jgi:hypothetical protein
MIAYPTCTLELYAWAAWQQQHLTGSLPLKFVLCLVVQVPSVLSALWWVLGRT